jgi:hypothetical protein
MFKRAAIAFSILSCTAAFGAEEPKWLKDARARELKSSKPAEIQSKDGWFKARVPGKQVGIIEKIEGSYSVEIGIGGDVSVHCEVFPGGADLANALRVTLNNAIKVIEESQGKLEARALESTDSGAYGPVPYLQLAWLYRISSPEGPRVGSFKQFVMDKGGIAVYCAHNDLGYARTFTSITRGFAETLEIQDATSAPRFVEISTASMAGRKIGIAISTVEQDSDGDTKAMQITSMLLATQDGNVQSQDSTHVDWIRPDGTLINSANTDVSNGEVENNLTLKEDEGSWVVEGEMQGKAVKTALPKDTQPGNWLGQAQQLRTLLAEPDAVGREHSIGIWLAENPEKLTVARTRILSKQGDGRFTARGEIGSLSANLTLDKATGTATSADVKVGPVDMRLERVLVSGSP